MQCVVLHHAPKRAWHCTVYVHHTDKGSRLLHTLRRPDARSCGRTSFLACTYTAHHFLPPRIMRGLLREARAQ